jgi:hypothetical protein
MSNSSTGASLQCFCHQWGVGHPFSQTSPQVCPRSLGAHPTDAGWRTSGRICGRCGRQPWQVGHHVPPVLNALAELDLKFDPPVPDLTTSGQVRRRSAFPIGLLSGGSRRQALLVSLRADDRGCCWKCRVWRRYRPFWSPSVSSPSTSTSRSVRWDGLSRVVRRQGVGKVR